MSITKVKNKEDILKDVHPTLSTIAFEHSYNMFSLKSLSDDEKEQKHNIYMYIFYQKIYTLYQLSIYFLHNRTELYSLCDTDSDYDFDWIVPITRSITISISHCLNPFLIFLHFSNFSILCLSLPRYFYL